MDDSVNTLQSSTTAQQQQQQQCDVNESTLMISITNHHLLPPPPPPPFTDQQNHINNIDSIFWSKTLLPSSSSSSSSSSQPITAITTRNPKKRSRASRRAPTTVLSTNTDNFRSMVQEFTGIPPPPFASIPSSSSSSSSPLFPTTSFDLFGRPNYSTMMMRSNINNFDNLPQQPSMITSLLDSCYLPNTMQINPITFLPSNYLDQPPFLTHPKTTENLVFSNGFDGIQQTQIEDLVTFQQSPQSPSDE